MTDLLSKAVAAHGGLERWNRIHAIKVAASITGAIWHVKSQPDYLADVVMTVDTRKERLITDFPGQDRRFIFEPGRVVMERVDGRLIEARNDPEACRVSGILLGQALLELSDKLLLCGDQRLLLRHHLAQFANQLIARVSHPSFAS